MRRWQEGRTETEKCSGSCGLASQLFSTPSSLSSFFALKWKVSVIDHTEIWQWLSVVTEELLFVGSLNLKKSSCKIHTNSSILPLEKRFLITEEELDLLQILLSHGMPVFYQVTRDEKSVILGHSDSIGSFLRVKTLRGTVNQWKLQGEFTQLLALSSKQQCCG